MSLCKFCDETIHHWHALLTVTDGNDAGDYHKGCFDQLARKAKRGQWNIVFDARD